MERNTQKNSLLNLSGLLVAGAAAFVVARYCQLLAGQVATVLFGLGALVALVDWFQMRLAERERLEQLEFDEVTKGGAGGSALFNTQEAEAFPARRSREQFEKFFIPGFTLLLMFAQGAAAWWLSRWLGKMSAPTTLEQPLLAMGVLSLLALVLFLLGQYSSRLARLEALRLLSPGASQVLLGAYLLALTVAALAGAQFGFPRAEYYLALGFCWLLALLAFENLLNLLLEIYRPRVRGKVSRVLYESRLVGLFSHPEEVFTTAAHALDYQFGFKVSETWFYQFLQRSLAWLALAQAGILFLSTGFIYVEAGEQALLERFGQPVAGRGILEPGFHFKMPWPIDQATRYRTQAIQTFDIGFKRDEKDGPEPAVLWTVSHYKEEFHLLVASRETVGLTNSIASKKAPPVNLLTAAIPVQFQISNLREWAYNYSDSAKLLREAASREVVRYFVGVDVNEIMSTGRFTAGEQLRARLQTRADELKLGARILFVGLQDVHPPVKVGVAYEKFVGSKQQREADILRAQAYAARVEPAAAGESLKRRLTATADSTRRVAAAVANEALFTNQMAAYVASPEVYTQRAYLQTLAKHGSGARKFILATTNRTEVLQLNMEDKIRDDLLNVALPAPAAR